MCLLWVRIITYLHCGRVPTLPPAFSVILLSTLIPKGAFALNPKQISDQVLEGQPGSTDELIYEKEDEFKTSNSLTDSREKQQVV